MTVEHIDTKSNVVRGWVLVLLLAATISTGLAANATAAVQPQKSTIVAIEDPTPDNWPWNI